jgi:hypothetical protein
MNSLRSVANGKSRVDWICAADRIATHYIGAVWRRNVNTSNISTRCSSSLCPLHSIIVNLTTVVCVYWLKLSTSQFISWKFPSVGVVLNTNIWGQDGISLSLGMVEGEDVFRIGPINELPLSKRWNLGLQTN